MARVWHKGGRAVLRGGGGRPSFWTAPKTPCSSPVHIAFLAPSPDAVDRFYKVGLECGASSNGALGVRRGNIYEAFLIDLDGNNIEAAYKEK